MSDFVEKVIKVPIKSRGSDFPATATFAFAGKPDCLGKVRHLTILWEAKSLTVLYTEADCSGRTVELRVGQPIYYQIHVHPVHYLGLLTVTERYGTLRGEDVIYPVVVIMNDGLQIVPVNGTLAAISNRMNGTLCLPYNTEQTTVQHLGLISVGADVYATHPGHLEVLGLAETPLGWERHSNYLLHPTSGESFLIREWVVCRYTSGPHNPDSSCVGPVFEDWCGSKGKFFHQPIGTSLVTFAVSTRLTAGKESRNVLINPLHRYRPGDEGRGEPQWAGYLRYYLADRTDPDLAPEILALTRQFPMYTVWWIGPDSRRSLRLQSVGRTASVLPVIVKPPLGEAKAAFIHQTFLLDSHGNSINI